MKRYLLRLVIMKSYRNLIQIPKTDKSGEQKVEVRSDIEQTTKENKFNGNSKPLPSSYN